MSHFRLRDLPVEIRIQIFRQILLTNELYFRDGLIPNLVKALRTDRQLYFEALEIYYEVGNVCLSRENARDVKRMPTPALKRAVSLKIRYSVNRGDGWDTEFTPDLSALPLSRCSSITNVIFAPRDRLEVSPGIMDWDQQALTMIRRCIVELPSLRSLAIDISSIKQDVDRHGRSSPMTIPAVIPNHIDRATGVSCEGAIPLTWEAEKGQTLTWTDDVYARSIPWENIGTMYTQLSFLHTGSFWHCPYLHFLGLNPRVFIGGCRQESCPCVNVIPFRVALSSDDKCLCKAAPGIGTSLQRITSPTNIETTNLTRPRRFTISTRNVNSSAFARGRHFSRRNANGAIPVASLMTLQLH